MHLLLINGSPHREGSTYTALTLLSEELARRDITCQLFSVGEVRGGCSACGGCRESHRCVKPDSVSAALELACRADGIVFGSPVHYAGCSGSLAGFLDRLFYAGKTVLWGKCAAAVVVARRAGGTSALHDITRHFPLAAMPCIDGGYWNILFGASPADVRADTEGVQNLARLADAFARYRDRVPG